MDWSQNMELELLKWHWWMVPSCRWREGRHPSSSSLTSALTMRYCCLTWWVAEVQGNVLKLFWIIPAGTHLLTCAEVLSPALHSPLLWTPDPYSLWCLHVSTRSFWVTWPGLKSQKCGGERQLYLNFSVYTHTATTNMTVKEKPLVKSKQNRGKIDGRQESISKSLSLESTMPGWMVYFHKWCAGFII